MNVLAFTLLFGGTTLAQELPCPTADTTHVTRLLGAAAKYGSDCTDPSSCARAEVEARAKVQALHAEDRRNLSGELLERACGWADTAECERLLQQEIAIWSAPRVKGDPAQLHVLANAAYSGCSRGSDLSCAALVGLAPHFEMLNAKAHFDLVCTGASRGSALRQVSCSYVQLPDEVAERAARMPLELSQAAELHDACAAGPRGRPPISEAQGRQALLRALASGKPVAEAEALLPAALGYACDRIPASWTVEDVAQLKMALGRPQDLDSEWLERILASDSPILLESALGKSMKRAERDVLTRLAEALLRVEPDSVLAKFVLADSRSRVEELAKEHPDHMFISLMLVDALVSEGELSRALDIVDGLISEDTPHRARLRVARLDLLDRMYRFGEFLREGEDLLGKAPDMSPVILAEVYGTAVDPMLRDGERCLELLEMASSFDPLVNRTRALCLAELGRVDDALEALAQYKGRTEDGPEFEADLHGWIAEGNAVYRGYRKREPRPRYWPGPAMSASPAAPPQPKQGEQPAEGAGE